MTNQPMKPRKRQAEHLGDPLVAAERRDLAEHAVAVGLRLAGQVLRQAAGLAQRVLARGRVERARASPRSAHGRRRRAPTRLAPLDARAIVDPRARFVDRAARAARRAGCARTPAVQTTVLGQDRGRRRRASAACASTDSGRRHADVDARAGRAAAPRSRRAAGDLGRGSCGAASTSTQCCASSRRLGVVAQRVADEVGELGERLDARVAGADEYERQLPPALALAARRRAASSRLSTWFRRLIASARVLKPSACSARPGIGSVRETAPSATTSSS